jgi:hypothetical protein
MRAFNKNIFFIYNDYLMIVFDSWIVYTKDMCGVCTCSVNILMNIFSSQCVLLIILTNLIVVKFSLERDDHGLDLT